MDEPLMTIGTFSRASLLSIKALRAYHAEGLLVPAAVDPHTGYRSYHAGQLADAATIRRLRDLDVPLAEIHEVIAARDPDTTRAVLARHTDSVRRRLADLSRIVDELSSTTASSETPVRLTEVPAQRAVGVGEEVAEQAYAEFLDRAFGSLWSWAGSAGVVPAGPPGALYPPEIHDDTGPVTAYLPVVDPDITVPQQFLILDLPATTAAVITHRGAYESIGPTYAALGSWVAWHARPSGDPVRERYLISYTETDDPADFRTEICWPVTTIQPSPRSAS